MKLGSKAKIEEYWNQAAPHLQTRYCHPSLGTKIKIQRVGDFIGVKESLRATDGSLIGMFGITRDLLSDEADLMVYMTHDIGSQVGVVGIAYLQVVCNSNKDDAHLKQSINEWQETTAVYGAVSFISTVFCSCFVHFCC